MTQKGVRTARSFHDAISKQCPNVKKDMVSATSIPNAYVCFFKCKYIFFKFKYFIQKTLAIIYLCFTYFASNAKQET